jgi:rare lipoprotein A
MRHRTMVAVVLVSVASISPVAPAAAKPAGKDQKGVASFYDAKDAGKTTASGKPLAVNRMTAASPTLPLGSKAKVVNTKTGRSAQVTITDRGPYAKGRVLDVTPKVAERLGIEKKKGVAPVVVKPVSKPAPSRP